MILRKAGNMPPRNNDEFRRLCDKVYEAVQEYSKTLALDPEDTHIEKAWSDLANYYGFMIRDENTALISMIRKAKVK